MTGVPGWLPDEQQRAAMRDLIDTVSFIDEHGDPAFKPGDLPDAPDPEADADSE